MFTILIGEGNSFGGFGSAGEAMDLISNRGRHGQRGPAATVDPASRIEVEKIITTSIITGAETNGTQGTCLHVITVFLMGLHILTKLNFAMSIEVKFAVENHFGWALGGGYATL